MMDVDGLKPHETMSVPDNTAMCLVVTLYDRVHESKKERMRMLKNDTRKEGKGALKGCQREEKKSKKPTQGERAQCRPDTEDMSTILIAVLPNTRPLYYPTCLFR